MTVPSLESENLDIPSRPLKSRSCKTCKTVFTLRNKRSRTVPTDQKVLGSNPKGKVKPEMRPLYLPEQANQKARISKPRIAASDAAPSAALTSKASPEEEQTRHSHPPAVEITPAAGGQALPESSRLVQIRRPKVDADAQLEVLA